MRRSGRLAHGKAASVQQDADFGSASPIGDLEGAEGPSYERMVQRHLRPSSGLDGGVVAGFDIGPPRDLEHTASEPEGTESDSLLPLTRDGRLDLTAIADMIRQKQLKEAARLLHSAPDELPDLAHGLQFDCIARVHGRRATCGPDVVESRLLNRPHSRMSALIWRACGSNSPI